ncbi:MAG: TetR family transcriptional regulator [Candidatus Aegiribacteria sp.]|nr:TetR family transcriptional regulator [Candidatus Aegiribacteria sp.]
MENNTGARQRIILTAIDILNREGISGITTRRIAEQAGVNSAALNYYFGSRDNLIEQALTATLEHAFSDWRMILENEDLNLPIRIFCFLDFTMEGIARYPGLVRSHLFDTNIPGNSRKLFEDRLAVIIDDLAVKLEGTDSQSREELRISLSQTLMISIFAAISPDLYRVISGDHESESKRADFLIGLLSRNLGIKLELTARARMSILKTLREAFQE